MITLELSNDCTHDGEASNIMYNVYKIQSRRDRSVTVTTAADVVYYVNLKCM